MELNKKYYCWLEECKDNGYVVPMADPMEYEYPFNYLFDNLSEALAAPYDLGVVDNKGAIPKGWRLVRVMYETVVYEPY